MMLHMHLYQKKDQSQSPNFPSSGRNNCSTGLNGWSHAVIICYPKTKTIPCKLMIGLGCAGDSNERVSRLLTCMPLYDFEVETAYQSCKDTKVNVANKTKRSQPVNQLSWGKWSWASPVISGAVHFMNRLIFFFSFYPPEVILTKKTCSKWPLSNRHRQRQTLLSPIWMSNIFAELPSLTAGLKNMDQRWS